MALEIDGDELLVDLVQNWELLAGTRGLVYYLPNGTRTTHRTDLESNCCYRGNVRKHLDSWASICICSGLSGLIVLSRDKTYILEPSHEGTRAYRLETVRKETGECLTTSLPHRQPYLRIRSEQLHRVRREVDSERGVVELVIVADPTEFGLDPDLERFKKRMVEIASHMDGFFRDLGLRVALVGIEFWNTTHDPLMAEAPQVVLERLLQWRQADLLPRIPHDNVQLIVGTPFPDEAVGAATQGSICSGRSGGISMDHSVSPLLMASTLSHQLGHNLGLDHDGASCGCDSWNPSLFPGRGCIMEPPKEIMPGLRFSSCSLQQIDRILKGRRAWCLLDVPESQRLEEPHCGNRLVESGEECDCGLREECADPCCNSTTCKLKPGAQCATGEACCHECKLCTAGFICRDPQNECDLPEYCSGTSPHCPANVHKQDGTPCGQGEAVCYGGSCPTYLSQCQELWGPDSRPVSDTCVESLNRRGDLEGHCGQQPGGSYLPCAKKNVFCGRLQCQNGGASTGKPNRTARVPVCPHHKPVPVPDVLDLAMALPGTVCGSGKVCVDQRCQNLSSLKLPKCQCNGHGVCNSKGHCHCLPGWAPPDCLQTGPGGSVDSGPIAVEQASNATSTALLLAALLLVTAAGLGFFAKRLGLHKRLCQFGKGTSCQYRITQPEPRSYSRAPPERPNPPQWRQKTEFQFMQNSKPPAPAKPPPPRKPLPSDPPRAELWAVPNYDLRVQMLPSRPAPSPPRAASPSVPLNEI